VVSLGSTEAYACGGGNATDRKLRRLVEKLAPGDVVVGVPVVQVEQFLVEFRGLFTLHANTLLLVNIPAAIE